MEKFQEIAYLLLPALLVGATAIYFFQRYRSDLHALLKRLTLLETKGTSPKNTRVEAVILQAYERLVLYLERIHPDSLVMRRLGGDKSNFHQSLLASIREEYEHNFSQQIYVSEASWQAVSVARKQLLELIQQVAEKEEMGDSSVEFGQEILRHYYEQEDFIKKALHLLRVEARTVLNE